MGNVALQGPILDSVATPSGHGYWMVGSDGGIFSFGDAVFYGSMGGQRLNKPVTSMAPDPDGSGYWLVHPTADLRVLGSVLRIHGCDSPEQAGRRHRRVPNRRRLPDGRLRRRDLHVWRRALPREPGRQSALLADHVRRVMP